jgi:uncharacterized protein (TIGR03437 family)
MKTLPVWLPLAIAAAGSCALAQVSATIDIDATRATPLNANFSGFNDEVVFPAEFYDYRLNNIAAQLSPGWVRYPSGLFSQAFNWQTGMMVPAWVQQFQGLDVYTLLAESVAWVNGKGGGSFVDGANRANFLGAKLIVCINGYTDTPASAGLMAAFAKANQIPVAVWELSNEPYLYNGFFASATAYLNQMKPFRDAIKAADPNATVAVFAMDAGDTSPNPAWDQAIASYTNKYWDAVTYHHYPPQSSGGFSQWMADENAVLYSKSSAYVTGYLAPLMPGTKFLISEFLPSNDGIGSGNSVTDGTLYGAIYAAEYAMRMSAVPSMLYVGMHALTGTRGVYAAQTHYNDAQNAYEAGTTIDTLTLNFGYFTEAQPMGLAVLNSVVRNATATLSTALTGGATVAATGLGQIPALYAQAYTSATGQQSLVITNKGATAQPANIRVNGTAVSGTLPMLLISGSDPTAVNTAATPTTVSVQTSNSANPVTVPAYSVVRVDLNSPAVVTVVNNASYAAGPVAPQEIVSLFGTGLQGQTAGGSAGSTSFVFTDSAGKSQAAPVFYASPTQANVMVPAGMAAGPATVTAQTGAAVQPAGQVTIVNSQPGLYSANADGAGVAAAVALLYTASGQSTQETVFTCNPPAARSCLPAPLNVGGTAGTLYIELYGTGISGAASVQCYVGGQSVPVAAVAKSSYPGEDQVNIVIPKSLAGAGDVRVYLVADGVVSNVVGLNLQ